MKKKKSILNILFTLIFFIFFWWLYLIIYIFRKNKNSKIKQNSKPTYQSKQLITEYEKYFYNILIENFSKNYLIMPQVNLSTIINKNKDFPTQYQNELNRNIDFGIFDKTTTKPLLLIEINDKTHNEPSRIARDKKVKEICQISKINLITFYSNYKNKKNYVISRIKNELKKD